MKTTSLLLGTMLMTCSAIAMAQSSSNTGGTVQGNGTGMTRTQANSTTMGVPGAMGNASGTADTQGVGNMSSSNDQPSPASTSTNTSAVTDSNTYPAAPPATQTGPANWTDNGPRRWDQN